LFAGVARLGPGEQEALCGLATHLGQQPGVFEGFNTLANDGQSQGVAQTDDRLGDRNTTAIVRQLFDKDSIDLQLVQRKPF
jgi:hypothetical protein